MVFKKDMYCEDELHFKKGFLYEILAEIKGNYAVSYMRKNPMECSLIPKDWDGFELVEK